MRIQRHKANRKTLSFFRLLFSIRAPFRILLDGNFLAQASRLKLEWRRLLPKLLDAPPELVHLHVSECVLAELESLGDVVGDALAEARELPLLKCRVKHGHSGTCEPGACAAALVGSSNEGKWCVVTQDSDLRNTLRRVPGVPILLISNNVLILEPPSAASRDKAASAEAPKSALRPEEALAVKAAVKALKKSGDGAGILGATSSLSASSSSVRVARRGHAAAASGGDAPPKKKKRRGPSEPNPLSQRKKSKTAHEEPQPEAPKSNRRKTA
jgi:U3 small nucleolar RNA-associated protein 23